MLNVQLLGAVLLTNMYLLKADYVFQFQVEHYFNTAHTCAKDGFCCDSDCSECENRFLFCLRPISFPLSSEECPLGNYSTGVIANDNIVFGAGDLDTGVPNPLVFNGMGAWPGEVVMYIQIDDEDDTMTGDSDLVTRFYIEINAIVGSGATSTTENGENAVGRLGASYRVSCADDFYTPDCVFCLARNDAQGHHTCDSQGNRVCLEGFEDPTSNCTQPCTPAEGCSPIGGYCNVSGNCICQNGYSGDSCEIDEDPCAHTTPCQNGGTCRTTGPDQFECQCVEGYEGDTCELMVTDECDPTPCQNQGTCVDFFLDYKCQCSAGYEGMNCSHKTDECIPNPCMNGGTCTGLFLDYECQCSVGYEGRICSMGTNECDPNPCMNNGSCTDLLSAADYSCSCTSGFTGRNCDKREDLGVDTQTVAVIGGAAASGILLLLIVVLVLVLVAVLKWQRQGKVTIDISGGQRARPTATEMFSAENPTYAGGICMKPLSGGTTITGDSADHQFQNPLCGSSEVEEGYHAKPGVQESPTSPVTPPLAAYYSTEANSPLVEPHPYNSAKGSKIPARRHQYDSIAVSPRREAEHTMPAYDHAEGFEGERQMYMYGQLEVSPPVQVAPTHHYDSVEGGRDSGCQYDSIGSMQ